MNNIEFSPIPINIVAVRTMFYKGEEYIPNKKVLTNDSDLPIEIHSIPTLSYGEEDLTGVIFGRFKVVGKAKNILGRWVVRCLCGKYSTRKRKAIKNEKNTQDRCEHCRQLAYIKREQYRKYTGIDKDINEF